MSDPRGFTRTESGLYVPERRQRYTHPTCVDLFCGAGGFSLGMISAGFQVVLGVDSDVDATMTYLYNLGAYPLDLRFTSPLHRERLEKGMEREQQRQDKDARKKGSLTVPLTSGGNWHDWGASHGLPGTLPVPHFYFGNVRELTGRMVLDAIGLEVGELDCIVGGPPCQGFTRAGKRNVMDPRNSLVFEFARLVLEIRPKTFVMENVPDTVSMVTPEGLPIVDALCRVLEDGGFGTFDALKRGLLSSADARAAFRGKPKREPPAEVQTTLFE